MDKFWNIYGIAAKLISECERGKFYSSLKNLFNGFFGHFFGLLSNVYITGGISVNDFFAIVEIVHINVVKSI